jgi:hypothetical protein
MFIPCFSWGLGSKIPCENQKSQIIYCLHPPPKQCFDIFFSVFLQEYCDGSCFLFLFNSLNTVWSGSKTCCSVHTILMILSTEGSEWHIFIFGVTHQFLKPHTKNLQKVRDDVYLIKSVWQILCFTELIWDILRDLIWCSEGTSVHTPKLEWLGVTTVLPQSAQGL